MQFVLADITKQSLWFSDNGEHLCYMSLNDSAVPEANLAVYSEPDSFNLFSEKVIIRYPTVSH